MTRDQFIEWKAFVQIEGPVGPGRDDLYAILQSSGGPVTNWLPWLKEYVDPDDKEANRPEEMYIPTAEERAWMATLPPRE